MISVGHSLIVGAAGEGAFVEVAPFRFLFAMEGEPVEEDNRLRSKIVTCGASHLGPISVAWDGKDSII